MIRFREFIAEDFAPDPGIMWHGSPSGDLRGGVSGLHLGTKKAATEALTARIGHPVDGEWDGTREYGKTKLAGQKTLKKRNIYPTGYNVFAPQEDYFPHEHPEGFPTMGHNVPVLPTHKPEIKAYRLVGRMTNTTKNPHDDFKANGYMKASLKKGSAKRGFYYKNIGEDTDSISAVVPGPAHVQAI